MKITTRNTVSSQDTGAEGPGQGVHALLLEVRKHLVAGNVQAALPILLCALTQEKDGQTGASIARLAGDLYQQTGQFDRAREVYSSHIQHRELAESYVHTFVLEQNLNGLLKAQRENRFGIGPPTYRENIQACLQRIAGETTVRGAHLKRFLDNVTVLRRVDPGFAALMAEKGFPEDYWQEILRLDGTCYVNQGEIAELVRQDPPDPRLTALVDAETQGFIAICHKPTDFLALFMILAARQCLLGGLLCCIVIDLDLLARLLTVADLTGIEQSGFVVRFVDKKQPAIRFAELLCVRRWQIPWRVLPINEDDESYFQTALVPHLQALEQSMLGSFLQVTQDIQAYYGQDFFRTIPDKIAARKLRVMFLTSRYTNFIQFCVRDLAHGFRQLGHETHILLEEEGAPAIIRFDVKADAIWNFRPDLIMQVNHNRNEAYIPKNLPCINWVQDENGSVFCPEGRERLAKYDLMLFAHPMWRDKLRGHGYPSGQLLPFMIPVNQELFHPRALSDEDRQRYGADISYIANCSATAQEEFNKLLSGLGSEFHGVLTNLYQTVCQQFAQGGSPCTLAQYREMFLEVLAAFGASLREDWLVRIAEQFWHRIGGMLYRQQPLQWLSEAGYDLALYGRGWERHPTLAKHARGWIENGDAMARVFIASTINLCVHQTGNYSSRVFDGIASGAFFLMRRHPNDVREGGLGEYFDLQREVVFFDSRENLLHKMDYYLKNEKERLAIMKRARSKILSHYTYERKIQELLGTYATYLASL